MIVLGFDTATQSTAVGLRLTDGETLQARDDPAPGGHPGHATRLLDMAGELLAAAGLGWSALERIAVGVGPGRFTGLRVGIATARGLAQSLTVELVGVSSLQALGQAAASNEAGPGATIALIDARRGERRSLARIRRRRTSRPSGGRTAGRWRARSSFRGRSGRRTWRGSSPASSSGAGRAGSVGRRSATGRCSFARSCGTAA